MPRLPLALLALTVCTALPAAPPADPPAEFAQPQSPAKPAPFPVKYVDQGGSDPRLKGILAPEGFQLEVVADAPTVVNPVGLTFTPDGTLLVLEWQPDPGREWYEFKETFRYRDGSTKAVATMKKFLPDPVKQLARNAKGVYEKAEVIFTDELPSTLLYHDGWLYTASRGTVRRYRQSQPGGKWDVRETIAQGFCGFHHHQVSGLTIGPDGWLYITSGDDDNFVEGSDGSRANVLRTGAVFRCKPDGSRMETFSLGYRNPYRDLAFDDRFNWFHADNDNEDGSRFTGCRLVHVAEEVDYGWRLLEGARCCRPDHVRGAVAGERAGKLQPMLKTGRGSPAGVLLYHDTQLPEPYRGLMYYPDVFRKSVRAYKLAPAGASFAVTHEFEFLKSDDPLFRPCQMVTGPDGAIYVCDWRTDSGGAGKLWGDGKHGRIYRLRWAGTAEHPEIPLRPTDTWAKVSGPKPSLDAVIDGCRSADQTTRQVALKEMIRRGNTDEARNVLRTTFRTHFTAQADGEKTHPVEVRLLCLAGLGQLWNDEVRQTFLTALRDPDADVQRVAAEGLGRHAAATDFAVAEALTKALADDSPAVRRAAALALGRLGADSAADALIAAWKADDGKDPFLTDAYLRGVERLGKKGVGALLALAQSGDDASLKRVATAFLALRTKPAADALPELIANPHLAPPPKADLIRSYLNYQFDPPLSLDPLAAYLSAHLDAPSEVVTAGLEVLAATGGLGGGKGTEFVLGMLDAKDEAVRLATLKAIENGRLLTAGPKLKVALTEAKRSPAEREAVLRAGRAVGGAEFVAAVKGLLASDTEAASLKVEALRTLAALEPPSAAFSAIKFLDQPDPALIAESISVLGATKTGARIVGEKYLAKKLPRDLFPRVSDALRKHLKDESIAKLNEEVLRGGLLLSLEPDQVEKVRARVQSGDPKKGKAVYLNTAALACTTCHKLEGVGGAVGPDLTRVWDTMTVEKMLETIVAPSKEIKEGYQTYKATTLGGQSYVGLKVTDTPDGVTIREATGRDVKISRKDLDDLTASKQSLMPDNVVSQLSYDQFIDLLAFLKSRKEQESLRGVVTAVQTVATKRGGRQGTGVVQAPPSQNVIADPSGVLVFDQSLTDGHDGLLVLFQVYSPKKQTAAVTLRADDTIAVNVNDMDSVFTRAKKANAFAEEEKFTVELREGWNPVAVQVVTGGSTHRLALQFIGDDLRTAAKPEK
jgi:putative membrane-bound dehydrogenase-like protein